MCGTMLIIPEGTLELDDSDVNGNSDDMTLDNLNLLEKAVVSYYVDNNDLIDDDSDVIAMKMIVIICRNTKYQEVHDLKLSLFLN